MLQDSTRIRLQVIKDCDVYYMLKSLSLHTAAAWTIIVVLLKLKHQTFEAFPRNVFIMQKCSYRFSHLFLLLINYKCGFYSIIKNVLYKTKVLDVFIYLYKNQCTRKDNSC